METRDQTRASVRPIPAGFHTLTPIISVKNVSKFLDFLPRAFGAVERGRFIGDDGAIMHAEVEIGDSILMVGEKSEKMEGATCSLYMYVENADQAFARAVDAGAKIIQPVSDQFYGDRSGCVGDEWGNHWFISTHIEDVPQEELKARSRASMR
jgi:PhnB protein